MNIACVIPLNNVQEEEELNDRGEGTMQEMAKLPKGTMKVEVVAITSGAQRGS